MPKSCQELKEAIQWSEDGEYWMNLTDSDQTSATVPVFCDRMHSNFPRNFITLPEGEEINYSMGYQWEDADPPTCVSTEEYDQGGLLVFSKIQIHPTVRYGNIKCIWGFYPSDFGCMGYCHDHDGWAGGADSFCLRQNSGPSVSNHLKSV